MSFTEIFDQNTMALIVIPFLIFIARIIDVSIGTLRVILVAKGMKLLAPLLGFFEVLIWLVAMGQILQNLTNWVNYLAYAAGFAMGNYIGIAIENRLALGSVIVRVITSKSCDDLIDELRKTEFGITTIDANGKYGPVKIIYMLISRHDLPGIISIINKFNPKAFYSVEDLRSVKEGVFPHKKAHFRSPFNIPMKWSLKRK